jgi:hypothetical protein
MRIRLYNKRTFGAIIAKEEENVFAPLLQMRKLKSEKTKKRLEKLKNSTPAFALLLSICKYSHPTILTLSYKNIPKSYDFTTFCRFL